MDERQQLYDDLKRYRALRDLTTDEVAIHRHRLLLRTHGGWPSTYCAGE
jgi:hypothetical protein